MLDKLACWDKWVKWVKRSELTFVDVRVRLAFLIISLPEMTQHRKLP